MINILTRVFARMARAFASEAAGALRLHTLQFRLAEIARDESAHYVLANMKNAIGFATKEELWEFTMLRSLQSTSRGEMTGGNGDQLVCMEFGVHKGRSINILSQLDETRDWVGFDSFEGLAEDWPGIGMLRGAFDVGGQMPKVRQNVTLIKGWFSDTLQPYLEEDKRSVGVLHLDADTYESTLYVLEELRSRFVNGTWIIFDEYFNYNGWKGTGEYLAFQEWANRHGATYSYRAYSEREVAIELHGLGE